MSYTEPMTDLTWICRGCDRPLYWDVDYDHWLDEDRYDCDDPDSHGWHIPRPPASDVPLGLRDRLVDASKNARATMEHAKSIHVSPFSGHDALVAFHQSRGVQMGICTALEILDDLVSEVYAD